AERLPHVRQRLEMVALVAHHMDELYDAPALQFLEAVADVGTRHSQRVADLLGVERLGRDVKQRVNLRDGAVDAPFRAHLAPMQDELLPDWIQFVHNSLISVTTEITEYK